MLESLVPQVTEFSPSLSQSLRQWTQESNGQDALVTLVACGMLKAGKSTLLNMLTNHVSATEERFKSAVVRETIHCSSYDFHGIRYTDTPGIDANSEDDAVAWQGVIQADILLFVHSWSSELQVQETNYLERIAKALPRETLQKRLIVVQTGKETIESYQATLQAQIEEQCRQALGFAPAYIAVSNTRYRKGVLENKSILAERSGISELRSRISAIQSQGMAQIWAARRNRKAMEKEALLQELDNEIRARQKKLAAIREPYTQQLKQFLKEMRAIQKSYQTQLANYEQL